MCRFSLFGENLNLVGNHDCGNNYQTRPFLHKLKVGCKCHPWKCCSSCFECLGNGTPSFRWASFVPWGCSSVETDQRGTPWCSNWRRNWWSCQSTTYDIHFSAVLRFLHELGRWSGGAYAIFSGLGKRRWSGWSDLDLWCRSSQVCYLQSGEGCNGSKVRSRWIQNPTESFPRYLRWSSMDPRGWWSGLWCRWKFRLWRKNHSSRITSIFRSVGTLSLRPQRQATRMVNDFRWRIGTSCPHEWGCKGLCWRKNQHIGKITDCD